MLTLKAFEEAVDVVKKVAMETELIYSDYLSGQTGNKVYLKPENLQVTGAYKIRGAYYKISTLTEEQRSKGLVTASAGNHAQGVAYAAKAYGCKAVIVMPTTTPLMKVDRTKSYGAEVVLYGNVYDEAAEHAAKLAEEKGFTQVLWLDGVERKYIEEVGSMNMMFKIDGKILTPELNGSILPGITRKSILELLRADGYDVEERRISLDEVIEACENGKLEEAWGCGTAAVVSPVGWLEVGGKEYEINKGEIGPTVHMLYDEITGIQWGKAPDRFGWTHPVK